MHVRGHWRPARMLAFVLVLGLVPPSLGSSLLPDGVSAGVPVALASDKQDRKDDKKHGQDAANAGHDGDADHQTEGQVIGINNLIDPPELTLGVIDGSMIVRVVKTDEIALNNVRLCDYVTLKGEKINEQLFEANEISVEDHHC